MKRLLTAVALLVFALYLIFWSPNPVFFGAATLVGVLCYREYSELVVRHGIRSQLWLGMAGGLLLLFLPRHALIGISLLIVLAFIIALRDRELRDVLPEVACIALGAFYTFSPWRFAIELRAISVHLLFFALALNWAGDSLAYYVGRRFGKHRLAPAVSPSKSWEGSLASVAGSVLFGVFYLGYFGPHFPAWQVVTMAISANVAGQFGDLAESAMKRGAGVKDSGELLPGHGGVLDRLDSSMFAIPVVYLFSLWK
ncbi:MAG: phosphatidate cytidylyltransferase [Acidobacteriaceae bacterium]|nr:phosphatidate cytidylyltransferase [Acidobacteriaceae bacterium]